MLTVVLLVWNRDLLMAFGASENTIGYGTRYMNIYSIGTIFVQLTLGMNAFITAQGFARTGMLSVLDRCSFQYHLRSNLYFWLKYGCSRSRACHDHISSIILYLGNLFLI